VVIELRLKIIGAIHGVIGTLSLPFLIVHFFYGPTAEQLQSKYYAHKLFIGSIWLNLILCFLIVYLLGTFKNWGRYLTILYDGILLIYFIVGPIVSIVVDPRELTPGILFFLIPISMLIYSIVFLSRPEVKKLMH